MKNEKGNKQLPRHKVRTKQDAHHHSTPHLQQVRPATGPVVEE